MKVIGLTGGIGSGKTTVGNIFTELGVPVYNSDKQAKKLMKSSGKVKKEIVALLGNDAYNGNDLNKSYIAKKVFNDKPLLNQLNKIVHPAVRRHFASWLKKQDFSYVIQEAAIIFENAMHKTYDKIILVTAPEKIRVQRIVSRDGSSETDILARMGNQWSDSDKIQLSDYVIENLDLEKTKLKVKEVHDCLLEYSYG